MLGDALTLAIMALTPTSAVILAFVMGTIAFIVTKSNLFLNLRSRVTHPFFKKLINCPYCLSFWLAAIWIILWIPYFLEILIAFAILFFVIGGLGGIVGILVTWLCKKAGI